MANNYFQFKEFTVYQEKCAMKVSTDACLLAALVNENISAEKILDIGSGTGVLSLMMAQKFSKAKIDAVEIEENAFNQTKENFEKSKWSSRLNAEHKSIQQFSSEKKNEKYQLIISNPPFFENDLLANEKNLNIARHSTELTLRELLTCAFELLDDDGLIYLLLPSRRREELEKYCQEIIFLKDNPNANIKRCVYVLKKLPTEKIKETTFVLKNEDGNYSEEFKKLMQPFYLKL